MSSKHIPISLDEWQDCFCGGLPTMTSLRQAFVQLLRYCFSDTEHYGDLQDELGCLTYKPGGGTDTISVYSTGSADPSNTNNIPGVLVSFANGIKYDLQAMQDYSITSEDFSRYTSYTIGQTQLVLSCNAFNADTSCAMADLCMLFIMGVKPRIMQAWGGWIRDMRVTQLLEPHQKQVSETDSAVIWYESQLVVDIQFNYEVSTAIESKRLKGFTYNHSIDT